MPNGCFYAVMIGLGIEAVCLTCLGGLSLIASGAGNTGSRLAVAAVGLGLGGAQLAFVILATRKKLATRPSAVEQTIIELAAETRAPVTVADVSQACAIPPDAAKSVLDGMVAKRLCEQVGADRFEVRGVGARRIQRKCPYCGASLSVRDPRPTCPQCGGSLELGHTDS